MSLPRFSRLLLLIGVLTSCTLLHADEPKPAPKGLVGHWLGSLKVGAIELRLALNIAKKPDGTLTGTMDSIDQSAKNILINSATLKDGQVNVEIKSIRSTFVGKMNADQTEIVGQWKQGGSIPITFKRIDKAFTMNRPQEPKKPYPYAEEKVTYPNQKSGFKLAATLTLPRGDGPFPAVILISGSGGQNRDEEIMGHRPFWILADHLTRKGVAVLRFDDRGVGQSTGNHNIATSADFADDAEAGIEYLKTRKEINPRQIGLMGHSEGGMIAPMVAARSADVAFIVLLAGPGIRGDDLLVLQGQEILKVAGVDAQRLADQRDLQTRIFAIVRSENDPAKVDKLMRELFVEVRASLTEAQKKELDEAKTLLENQIKTVQSPWFRFFLSFDPRPTLQKVKCPVLAINGEKDLQVPPKENLPEIEKAVKAGGNNDVTIKELPKLNHLFQECKTGAMVEYGQIEETFSPTALELTSAWILQKTAKR